MNLQPHLANDLVQLRPLRPTDFDALYRVAQDPLIWEQHPCPDRHLPGPFSRFFEDSLHSDGALVVLDSSTQTIIGSSRFKPIPTAPKAIEIGWSFLARKYWGGRYNKAVKQLMIAHAFLFVEDVIFYIGPENIRSQRAVQKLGATLIKGEANEHLIVEKIHDLTYRIHKTDWVGI